MTLRNRILSLAAPPVIAVAYHALVLGARGLGVLKMIEENAATFKPADAIPHLHVVLEEYAEWQADQERRAA